MSLCPTCGRAMCDCSPEKRGQSPLETARPLTPAEKELWKKKRGSFELKELALQNAHLRIQVQATRIGA